MKFIAVHREYRRVNYLNQIEMLHCILQRMNNWLLTGIVLRSVKMKMIDTNVKETAVKVVSCLVRHVTDSEAKIDQYCDYNQTQYPLHMQRDPTYLLQENFNKSHLRILEKTIRSDQELKVCHVEIWGCW